MANVTLVRIFHIAATLSEAPRGLSSRAYHHYSAGLLYWLEDLSPFL